MTALTRLDRRLRAMLGLSAGIVVAVAVAAALTLRSPAQTPPASGAAAVVPASALAYVHLSTDLKRPAVQQAIAVAERFPAFLRLAGVVTSRFGAMLGGAKARRIPPLELAGEVEPWLGREAALALLVGKLGKTRPLVVVGVRRRARALAFLTAAGAAPDGSYDGIQLLRYRPGSTLAFVRHYLVAGGRASVRAAIAASSGRSPSLQDSRAYQRAAAGEPDGRVLDVYLSPLGIGRELAARGGLLGALAVLLYQRSLTGTTISLSATSGGAELQVHRVLAEAATRGAASSEAGFTPSLASVMPSGSTLLLDIHGLGGVAPRVLDAGAAGGIGGRIGPLLQRLGDALSSEGVDVPRIVSLFSGETAVAVSSGAGHGRRAGGAPALVILARTPNEQRTRTLLADLEGPLAQLFPTPSTGPGQAPEFNDVSVAGVTVHQLSLAPGLALDYSVFRGLVVVSTSLQAIGAVARHAQSLAQDPSYQATLGNIPSRVTSLLFFDFNQLLKLVEKAIPASAQLVALRPDLEKIRAVGFVSTSGEAETTAELFLQIP